MYGSCLELGQTADGYSVVIYTPTDEYCCPASLCGPVSSVTNLVSKPKDVSLSQMNFWQETYINSVLADEMFHIQHPAANTIGIPTGQPQSFHHVRPSRP
jgi:hypothetical protein